MVKRNNLRRPKMGCICRCMPRTGIEFLTYDCAMQTYYSAMKQIANTRTTGIIADVAVRTGALLERTNHAANAITLYQQAIHTILAIDRDRAIDYYENGPLPGNPYYRFWSARISMADALAVAERLDTLYRSLNLTSEAHQQRRVRRAYDSLFYDLYGD